jgi:hypothetical protein
MGFSPDHVMNTRGEGFTEADGYRHVKEGEDERVHILIWGLEPH